MVTNNYLDLDIQKAFANNVPGCIEHHQKLQSAIADAKTRHRSLTLCWLDLANAYGSVPHNLIHFSLRHYHAPPQFSATVMNLYSNLSAMISSKHWNTSFIPFKVGVFQGDPLSVSIFNTVINTLVDVITSQPQLGYTISTINHPLSLLQYADDSCLVADGPASSQKQLNLVDRWLHWSGLKAKVSKCCSLAIRASSSKPFNPNLSLNQQPIPYLHHEPTKFLGLSVSFSPNHQHYKSELLDKLSSLMTKVDRSLVSRSQKIMLYSRAICPRLSWLLLIHPFSPTWLTTQADPIATRFLKKWCGLCKSADPNRFYLPRQYGGMGLPAISTSHKAIQVSKASQLMSSSDKCVQDLAYKKPKKNLSLKDALSSLIPWPNRS